MSRKVLSKTKTLRKLSYIKRTMAYEGLNIPKDTIKVCQGILDDKVSLEMAKKMIADKYKNRVEFKEV